MSLFKISFKDFYNLKETVVTIRKFQKWIEKKFHQLLVVRFGVYFLFLQFCFNDFNLEIPEE